MVTTFSPYLPDFFHIAKDVEDEKPGHKAYAKREAERWHRWAETARAEFADVLHVRTSPV